MDIGTAGEIRIRVESEPQKGAPISLEEARSSPAFYVVRCGPHPRFRAALRQTAK